MAVSVYIVGLVDLVLLIKKRIVLKYVKYARCSVFACRRCTLAKFRAVLFAGTFLDTDECSFCASKNVTKRALVKITFNL